MSLQSQVEDWSAHEVRRRELEREQSAGGAMALSRRRHGRLAAGSRVDALTCRSGAGGRRIPLVLPAGEKFFLDTPLS